MGSGTTRGKGTTRPPAIRILVADEQQLFRDAIRMALESQPDLRVVAEAGTGLQAVTDAQRTRPDVVLVCLTLPVVDGFRATRLITERLPRCRVLLLADDEEPGLLAEALVAGATGYLTKDSPVEEVIAATRTVHEGGTVFPERLLGAVLTWLLPRRRAGAVVPAGPLSSLSRRENQVLVLMAQRADNREIGSALGMGSDRAQRHIRNILQKLGLETRLDAAAFLMRAGVLEDLVRAERIRLDQGGGGAMAGTNESLEVGSLHSTEPTEGKEP
jgi:two-component system, NarL family, nitrate/nitrite response regulator NarL